MDAKGSAYAANGSLYDELYVYTMGRSGFVLQHVVDAFGAQSADENTKPIALVFCLVGLYLRVEKNYSGRQVQQVHMRLARHKEQLPYLALPKDRGSMSAKDVLAAAPGPDRDRAIDSWCQSVWDAFRKSHLSISGLLQRYSLI